MKFLLPTFLFMLCVFASTGVVESASVGSIEGHQMAEALSKHVIVGVSDGEDEDGLKVDVSEQNVEKELDAFDRAEGDRAVVAEKRNCCTCDGGHECCGSICLGRK